MTTALWTTGPVLPSLSAGHKYVLTRFDPGLELWKRTCRSGWKVLASYSIAYWGI